MTERICESLAMKEASYEIALVLAKKRISISYGEEIVKPCLQIFARSLGDKSNERQTDEIALSKQTVTRRTEELSDDVFQQLKTLSKHVLSFHLRWSNQLTYVM